jgi:hypothetical protein
MGGELSDALTQEHTRWWRADHGSIPSTGVSPKLHHDEDAVNATDVVDGTIQMILENEKMASELSSVSSHTRSGRRGLQVINLIFTSTHHWLG